MKIKSIIDKARKARRGQTLETDPFPPEWIEQYSYEILERLAIRTVYGGMTDSEALRAEGLPVTD